jgi:hypothetical protein
VHREKGPDGATAKRHTHGGNFLTRSQRRQRQKGARLRRGQKIKGRERHIAVYTEGNQLASNGAFSRYPGPGRGSRGADASLLPLRHSHGGLRGRRLHRKTDRVGKQVFDYSVKVVKRTEQHLFACSPSAGSSSAPSCAAWSRRLSKDYELRPRSAKP